jgi:hypothetical protein
MKLVSCLLFVLISFIVCQEGIFSYFSVKINEFGPEKLTELKSFFKSPSFTIELDDKLLVFAQHDQFVQKVSRLPSIEYELLSSNIHQPRISILRHTHYSEILQYKNVQVLMSGSGFVILHSNSDEMLKSLSSDEKVLPFEENMVLGEFINLFIKKLNNLKMKISSILKNLHQKFKKWFVLKIFLINQRLLKLALIDGLKELKS